MADECGRARSRRVNFGAVQSGKNDPPPTKAEVEAGAGGGRRG